MKKKNKLLILNIILFIAGVVLICMVTGYLRQGLTDVRAAENYDEVRSSVVDIETHTVNFSAIRDAGSPSTAWLYVPDTMIDYPLVQGPDNDTYLDMDAYGNPSKAGAIFINFANSGDLSDAKTVIFGHNMSDGSMFSALHNYNDEEWGKAHQDAYIYMDDGKVRHYRLLYHLFTEPLNEPVYVVSKAEKAEDAAMSLKGLADIVYNDYSGGKLICLSTCTYHTFRTVVVFEYVDDSEPVLIHEPDIGSVRDARKDMENMEDAVDGTEETETDGLDMDAGEDYAGDSGTEDTDTPIVIVD